MTKVIHALPNVFPNQLLNIVQEFDLKSIEWDQETLQRWKTFAKSATLLPFVSVTQLIATPPFIASPPRTRPAFKGMRVRTDAQKAES